MFSRRSVWTFGLIAVFLIAAALFLSSSSYILCIRASSEGKDLARIPVAPGDRFEMKYTHSMFGVPQVETFSIEPDGHFRLEKVSFGSQAAALYYDPAPRQPLTFRDGFWVLPGDGTDYSVLRYRVSPGTGHVLTVKDRKVDLSRTVTAPGELIEVKMEESPRIAQALSGLWRKIG